MSFLYERIARPLMFRLDAETAHDIGRGMLKAGVAGRQRFEDPILRSEVFGLEFENPLGMAAGFDKNGLVADRLADLGFGFVEVGTVTLRPQPGNEKPRMFRLPRDRALINRLGFNNEGAEAVADRLRKIRRECVIGVNIGKNKDVPNDEAVQNYLDCLRIIHPVADYIAVNISSPNTPGLRELQQAEHLSDLIGALSAANRQLGGKPLLVKIAPDLSDAEIEAAVDACVGHDVAGIIATNTTVSREGLRTPNVAEIGEGGLSGRPLAARSNEVISRLYTHTGGRLPIIGVGGVFSGQDAFDKIAAGASLVQAYTGFIYGGPHFASELTRSLAEILRARGFASVSEAVGSGHQNVPVGAA
ncbi:MAG TPA: quinone-dependent dihydroorotate dehydrogenase [Pyrinomonadaceae bacterium]|nr:quinone-dependent dihydroorotate dehydrogenase [Pyrinomonadaceae bacterium]